MKSCRSAMVINRCGYLGTWTIGCYFAVMAVAISLPDHEKGSSDPGGNHHALDTSIPVAGIGCYVCDSINGSDPTCTDPFHPANSTYIDRCQDGKPEIMGQFPARYCIKIFGQRWVPDMQTYIDLFIRRCAVDSLGDQTGSFVFPGKDGGTYLGSIKTCDYNGCNSAGRLTDQTEAFLVFLTSAIVLARMHIRLSCVI